MPDKRPLGGLSGDTACIGKLPAASFRIPQNNDYLQNFRSQTPTDSVCYFQANSPPDFPFLRFTGDPEPDFSADTHAVTGSLCLIVKRLVFAVLGHGKQEETKTREA